MVFLMRIILLTAALLTLSCQTTEPETTGVTETGNTTVVGIIEDSEGQGVEDLKLVLRPGDYLPGFVDSLVEPPDYEYSEKTQEAGAFTFELPEDFKGQISLEGISSDSSQGVFYSGDIDANKQNDLGALIYSNTLSLRGNIFLPPNGIGTSGIQIRGTTRSTTTHDSSGDYTIENLAPGSYKVVAGGVEPLRSSVSITTVLNNTTSGEDINLLLGDPNIESAGAFSGTVILPGTETGTFDMMLVELDGVLEFDVSTGMFQGENIPVGDYTVTAWGLEPPRDTVSQSFSVQSGLETTGITLTLGSALPGVITGTVQQPVNTKGLFIAAIKNTTYQAVVNDDGTFELDDIPPGIYSVQVYGLNPSRDTLTTDSVVVPSADTARAGIFSFPIKALIVDGINNHAWEYITAGFISILEETNLFVVDVSSSPPENSTQEQWDAWRPDFFDYDVVISNYNSGSNPGWGVPNPWPPEVQLNFENYVSTGGGFVTTHATHPSHNGWLAYEQMKGLSWRPGTEPGITLDSLGNITPVAAGERTGAWAFGESEPTRMITVTKSHPITAGLPDVWLHPPESLTWDLKGPAENMTVLISAPQPGETFYAPQIWTVPYGSGRVYNITPGDVTFATDDDAIRCVGFQTLFIRGVEWAATSDVTYAVPDNFPDETAVQLNDNIGE